MAESLLDYLAAQGLPTEQPVVAVPATDYPAFDLAAFQQQFTGNGGVDALNQYIAAQAAQGKNYVSPIDFSGSPMLPGMQSGLLSLYGATPEEQALRYFNLNSRDTTVPITFDPRTYGGGYQLVDASGNVTATAKTAEELQALVDKAAARTGAKDVYAIQGTRGNGETETIYRQTPQDTFGDLAVLLASVALPAAGGAVLGPALAGSGALGIGVSAPVGVGLGTAAGTAASGVLAGQSVEDILLRSAIAGLTAGGLQALAGPSGASSAKISGLAADLQPQVLDGALTVAQASEQLARAGATAADLARFAADVGGAVSSVPTVIGNVANAVSGAVPVVAGASGAIGAATSVPGTIVQGRPDPADIIRANPQIGILDPLLAQFTQDEIIDATRRVQQEQDVATTVEGTPTTTIASPTLPAGTVVNAPTTSTTPADQVSTPVVTPVLPAGTVVNAPTTSTTIADQTTPPTVTPLLPAGTVVNAPTTSTTIADQTTPSVATPLLPAGTVVNAPTTSTNVADQTTPPTTPPITTVVGDTTKPPLTEDDIRTLPNATTLAPNTSDIKLTKDSTLEDILKYYSIGSGILDMLGVGSGGGGSGKATPYTSQLGALPNFSRGAFTPFTGDYEQYGFGPEWNFFGGAKSNG